jgi:hypothetical protein
MSADSLKLYEALEQAKGEPKQVARAISDFIHDDASLATKADIAELRAATKADIAALELRLIKWLVGTVAGSVGQHDRHHRHPDPVARMSCRDQVDRKLLRAKRGGSVSTSRGACAWLGNRRECAAAPCPRRRRLIPPAPIAI